MPSDEEWADADDLTEDLTGHRHLNPEHGIADMKRRIAAFEERWRALSARVNEEPDQDTATELHRLNQRLTELRTRLAEYEHQLKDRN